MGSGMLSLIMVNPTTTPVWVSWTAHGRGIARASSRASVWISAMELM